MKKQVINIVLVVIILFPLFTENTSAAELIDNNVRQHTFENKTTNQNKDLSTTLEPEKQNIYSTKKKWAKSTSH